MKVAFQTGVGHFPVKFQSSRKSLKIKSLCLPAKRQRLGARLWSFSRLGGSRRTLFWIFWIFTACGASPKEWIPHGQIAAQALRKKRQPSYRIIAIESKSRREARPLEELGYYNPRTKETVLETAGLLKWLRCGAQPTETVDSLLKKAGIYEMLKAGEGGVVASIRIPAMAKPEAGIPEAAEEAPATESVAEAEVADVPESELSEATTETAAAELSPPEAEVEKPQVEEAVEA